MHQFISTLDCIQRSWTAISFCIWPFLGPLLECHVKANFCSTNPNLSDRLYISVPSRFVTDFCRGLMRRLKVGLQLPDTARRDPTDIVGQHWISVWSPKASQLAKQQSEWRQLDRIGLLGIWYSKLTLLDSRRVAINCESFVAMNIYDNFSQSCSFEFLMPAVFLKRACTKIGFTLCSERKGHLYDSIEVRA